MLCHEAHRFFSTALCEKPETLICMMPLLWVWLFSCRLNAVREMCVRCPLVLSEDLLRDLTGYKSYHDKSVMMAARSLIHLYRDINPDMLHRKDRVSG